MIRHNSLLNNAARALQRDATRQTFGHAPNPMFAAWNLLVWDFRFTPRFTSRTLNNTVNPNSGRSVAFHNKD